MNGYSTEDRPTCSQINNIIHMVTSASKSTKERNVTGRARRAREEPQMVWSDSDTLTVTAKLRPI